MFGWLLNSIGDYSRNGAHKREIEELQQRLNKAFAETAEHKNRALSAEKKIGVMASEVSQMTADLRVFTGAVLGLTVLSESRTHILLARDEFERRYGNVAKARACAAALLRSIGDADGWTTRLAEGGDALTETASGYWLSAATLALAAWRAGDVDDAGRRVRQAVLADDARASLYFCLLSSKFRRQATVQWLRRYFAAQNPVALDEATVTMYLAAGEGFFGASGRLAAKDAALRWVAGETMGEDAFSEERLAAWVTMLSSTGVADDAGRFLFLAEHAANGKQITASIEGCAVLAGIKALCESGFQGPEPSAAASAAETRREELNRILMETVAAFREDEALPRRDLRFSALLIETDGDIGEARARLEAEWPLESERVRFSALLAAIVAGERQTSSGARRVAAALAKPWLRAAAEKIGRTVRETIPEKIELNIGEWSGHTVAGDNASELLAEYGRHWDEPAARKGQPKWLDEATALVGVVAVLIGIGAATVNFLGSILVFCAFGGYLYWRLRKAAAEAMEEREFAEGKRSSGMTRIASVLSEASQYRRFVTLKTREFTQGLEQLDALSPVFADGDAASPEPAAVDAAVELPAWDLEPPAVDIDCADVRNTH